MTWMTLIFNEKLLKMTVRYVDICCGLTWGDEGKGKIVCQLAKSGKYDYVCRWAGGDNAGHTVIVGGKKYITHLIPSGVFYGVKSIIGPGCVINRESFIREIECLKYHGFDTSLVRVSRKAHLVFDHHINEDIQTHHKTQGSTAKGIAQCYRDKYARVGKRAEEDDFFKDHLWDEKLEGKILCEGAQGFWLDVDQGNYPYVTSSTTLPYGACSLGFPPQKKRRIFGAAKVYDTRSGSDPDFPEKLMEDEDLKRVGKIGEEFGSTTGRERKVNWLNLDKLIKATQITGTSVLVISKVDVLEKIGKYKTYFGGKLFEFSDIEEMSMFINYHIRKECPYITRIYYSDSPEEVRSLI